jgi:hypothetical protein
VGAVGGIIGQRRCYYCYLANMEAFATAGSGKEGVVEGIASASTDQCTVYITGTVGKLWSAAVAQSQILMKLRPLRKRGEGQLHCQCIRTQDSQRNLDCGSSIIG